MKAGFITPYNKYEEMEYYDILEYCKYIATLPMFKDDFEEFKKDYHYFNAFFDFVMFKLGYIMINPLFLEGKGAIVHNGDLCFFYNRGDDYDTVKGHTEDRTQMGYIFSPRMTRCDDLTLQIKKQEVVADREVLIDPNMIGMMSKSAVINSSHMITGNTVLNQLLIASKEVVDDYEYFFNNDEFDGIEYLVDKMGFIRLVSINYAPLMVINRRVCTLKQKAFFNEMEKKYNYGFCNSGQKVRSRVPLYRKVLKQTKKELD